jgi:hypothetical protein
MSYTDEPAFEVAGVTLYDSHLAALSPHTRNRLVEAADTLPEGVPHPVLSTTAKADWRRVRRVKRRLKDGTLENTPNALDRRDRAAVRRYAHEQAHKRMSEMVCLLQSDPIDADVGVLKDQLGECLALWRLVQPLANPLDDQEGGDAAGHAQRSRRAPRGKRRSALRGLPDDWQVQLLRAADPRDRPWMAILAITGLRPAALVDSHVEIWAHGDALHLTVPASKDAIGQYRYMDVLNIGPISAPLYHWVRKCGNKVRVSAAGTDAFMTYDRMAARHHAAARRAFGRGVPLTAHRQQLHADLKAAGWPRIEIAKATDKVSGRTASVYATAHQGRAGAVEPLRAVRCDWAILPRQHAGAGSYGPRDASGSARPPADHAPEPSFEAAPAGPQPPG